MTESSDISLVPHSNKSALSWKKKSLFAFIFICFPLLFLEISLRVFGFKPRPAELSMKDSDKLIGKAKHPGVCYSMPPSVSGFHAGVSFKTNNLGFRDIDRNEKKAETISRILIIGDSMVFGQAMAQEKIFTRILEKKLGKNFEVWNAGHCAYNTQEEYHFLKYRGLKFEPDAVVLGFCLVNDTIACEEASKDYEKTQLRQKRLAYQFGHFLEKNSALVHFGSQLVKFRIQDKARTDYLNSLYEEERWKKMSPFLRKTYDLCRVRKIPFYLMVFPITYAFEPKNNFEIYRFQHLHKKVNETLKNQESVFFVDLLEPLKQYQKQNPKSPLVVPYDGHPNENYHQVIADVLYQQLSKQFSLD